MVYCQSQCPFGFDSVTSNPIRRLQENEPPTSEPSSQPFITAESTAQRKESPATSQFLDTSALTNCRVLMRGYEVDTYMLRCEL